MMCLLFFTINGNFLLAVIDDQYSISSTSFSICLVHCKYVRILCILAYSLQIILTEKVLFYVIYSILYYVLCLYHAFSPVCTLSEMTK